MERQIQTKNDKKQMKQNKTKKGQITIFIIIGIVLLAGVMFLTYITTTINRDKLSEQQTNVIRGLLNSQNVEFFVNDCAKQALKTGLITIGQNGGFEKIKPNLLLSSGNTNYSMLITKPTKNNAPPKYPCFGGLDKPPYCKYPNSYKTKFGKKNLLILQAGINTNTVNGQLQKYIKRFAKKCTEDNLTKIPSFTGYDLKVKDPSVKIKFSTINEAVEAKIKIPIEMSIGGTEPIIRLTQFDTKIPLRFKEIYKLVNTVIDKELTNATYDPTNESTKINITITKNPGINSFYTIEDKQHTIDGQPYVFRFAIQNRPPALQYINKNPTSLYDYLVIEKDDKNITLNPKADDPDYDNYSTKDTFLSSPKLTKILPNKFVYDITAVGWYNISIKATDTTGQEDNQTVRILIDKKINATFNNTFYNDTPKNWASTEDPYLLNATKKTSLDPNAIISYTWSITNFNDITTNELCIDLNENKCDITTFNIKPKQGSFFDTQTQPDIRTIVLTTKVDYGTRTQTSQPETKVLEIKQCLPHKNNKHPWAYPYQNQTDNNEDGIIDGEEQIDPFLSTHSCCSERGEYLDENTVCGEKVETFCKGNTILYKKGTRQFCDGKRGNVCQGSKNIIEEKQNQCGSKEYDGCKIKSSFWIPKTSEKIEEGIDTNCQNWIPFLNRTVNGEKGVCLGPTGCEAFCTSEWVDNGNGELDSTDTCGCKSSLFSKGDNGKECYKIIEEKWGLCQGTECV